MLFVKRYRILSSRFKILFLILSFSMISFVSSTTYYVSPNGDDAGTGSIEKPLASLKKGSEVAVSGDTVYIRGGKYAMRSGISIKKSGTSKSKNIYFFAFYKERPVFDFSGITTQTNGVTISNSEWLHFKGLEFCNVPQLTGKTPNCVLVDHSSHIIFEQCEFHHNGGTGLFISYGSGGHLILNCDSHHNYDPKSSQGDGQNADGFGVHYQTAGTDTTVVRGCRGWWNSDDGIDCIHQNTAVIFEKSWFWLNGYKPGSMDRPLAGNGQGVKAGGYDLPPNRVPAKVPQNIVRFCVSFLNGDRGFNTNYHPVACYWYNNTAFSNRGANFFMQGITYSGGSSYTRTNRGILRNNLSFKGTDITYGTGDGVNASNNSWDLSTIKVSSDDFISIDTAGVFGPRKEDGSLPDVNFLRLAAGSDLIDRGLDVGLPFNGKAPDLGAFEYQEPTPIFISVKSQKTSQMLTGFMREFDFNGCRVFDLSGRLKSPSNTGNASNIIIRDQILPDGSQSSLINLYLR